MDNRISPTIEGRFGPILLLTATANPTLEEILRLEPESSLAVCDFHVEGCQNWAKRDWAYEDGRVNIIDHHAPDSRWERQISSGNLARLFVEARGPCPLALINHTDCDSIISAGIAAGLLSPSDEYDKAVIAADHTGEENAIADLLQALQNQRDPAFSFECLRLLECGRQLPERAVDLLNDRTEKRSIAKRLVADSFELRGRLACFRTEHKLDGAMVAPLVSSAWVVAIAFTLEDNSQRNEIKLRLTGSAPNGLSLQRLGLNAVDPSFSGRWNAGSNKRGGGTALPIKTYFDGIAECLQNFEMKWMLGRAVQIAVEAHEGQFDKSGAPYFLHPLRVMNRCKSPIAKIAGALHDVIEDCEGWTLDRLRQEGFSEDVIRTVDLVTHKAEDQTDTIDGYISFVSRCAADPIAKEVKLADIEDNMDVSRIPNPTDRDWARLEKYESARLLLLGDGLTPLLRKQLEPTNSTQFKFPDPSNFNKNASFDVRFQSGAFVDARTGIEVVARDGALARLTIPQGDVKDMPGSHLYCLEAPVPFLERGTLIFAGVKIDRLSDDLRPMLFNLDKYPVRLAKWNPEDPLNPILKELKGNMQFVEMKLVQNLQLLYRGTKLPQLCNCKVSVPALEQEFDSVNQAYSAIAAVFEPWRRSTASNAFRTAFTVVEHTSVKGELEHQLHSLDLLRARAQQVLLALTKT